MVPNQFRPILKKTISQEIVEQILSLIRTDNLKAGQRLPSERELSQSFGVARSSVREAMKILEATGLVRTSNRGNFIRETGSDGRPSFRLDRDRTNIHELFEARKLIEIELSAVAAARATPEDVSMMRQALVEKKDRKTAAIAKDIAFHRALVNAARNSVFSEIYNSVTGFLFQHFKYYSFVFDTEEFTEEYRRTIAGDHLRIMNAVESRDPGAARSAMKDHLDRAEEKFIASLEAKIRKNGDRS